MSLQKDYFSVQIEEIETLKSIYDDEFVIINEEYKIFEIKLKLNDKFADIQFTLPFEYPDTPPICELSIPWIRGDVKKNIESVINELVADNYGCSIIYQIVEKVREELQKRNKTKEIKNVKSLDKNKNQIEDDIDQIQEIFHGEPFVDRKSTFQAHIAVVKSENDVSHVKKQLMKNNKIAMATHNISAFRIRIGDSDGKILQSCDDDGENKASERLLNMLVLMGIEDVFVLVSRWFGGIKLGPDRFKHINNTAKDAINQCGWFQQKV